MPKYGIELMSNAKYEDTFIPMLQSSNWISQTIFYCTQIDVMHHEKLGELEARARESSSQCTFCTHQIDRFFTKIHFLPFLTEPDANKTWSLCYLLLVNVIKIHNLLNLGGKAEKVRPRSLPETQHGFPKVVAN